jgi:2-polyprenyl-3-methyl-5-hydroxy-6-metoxy-1,4-benzoquinol methylase
MRIGVIPENLMERVGLWAGLAPLPLAESWFTFLLARTVMLGTKLGVFEALADGNRSAAEIAAATGTDTQAMGKLLNALLGSRYLEFSDGRYRLTPMTRRWLLQTSPQSVRDKVLFQFWEWATIERAEEYLKSGRALDVHGGFSDDEWGMYQRGMRSGVEPIAAEVVRRFRLPRSAGRMLDVGGAHGFFSVAFCRKHSRLSSVVLDLPQAVRHSAPILQRENMGERVVHQEGDALTTDLGKEQYDFVLLSSLVHHFDDATNRALMARCAAAIKPGGVCAVFESLRVDPAEGIGQIGGLMDLFFGITSASGTWSAAEIGDWQHQAGLKPRKPMRLFLARDVAVVAADKPR